MSRKVAQLHSFARGLALLAAFSPLSAIAFDSGSTGADGAFSPTVDTVLQVPPSGVFNFTNVNIPAGVSVTFRKNTLNTPVTWLAAGDVVIAGTVHANGGWAPPTGAAGDGNVGDDGLPGTAGAGGYDGGRGGEVGQFTAENGHGPGGGTHGTTYTQCIQGNSGAGGGGGGYGTNGTGAVKNYYHDEHAPGGPVYGSELLLPLLGGSGGGGGAGGLAFPGSGGGGGGGALLIAASGAVEVTGELRADGGRGGAADGSGVGGTGGGGSGGAIRIVATQIIGNGAITALGGGRAGHPTGYCRGGSGGAGRIRLEAERITRTSATNPSYSFGEPSTVFVAGLPTLRIKSVAGVAAPAEPTGQADIVLPTDTPNPVVVEFETTGVPVGNTVKLTLTPAYGDAISATSPALTGTTDKAGASVSIDLPPGPSVLLAQTTYTILAEQGDALSQYTDGERVEKIVVAADLKGGSRTTLITVSGKEFTLPSRLPAMPAAG